MTQAEIPKRNKKIVQLAKENYTADQISEIMGIKRYRVLQILKAFNVKEISTEATASFICCS